MSTIRLALGCSLALLAGCANLAAPLSSPSRIPGDASVARTLPHRDVLYVSDILDSRIDIYPLNANDPASIGEIVLDVDTPTGISLDGAQNLYVANNETRNIGGIKKGSPNILPVYPPGSGSPSLMYFQDLHHPTDVVIGGDGTVYVASFGDGYVTEYPNGSMTPSLHFQAPSGSAFSVALDASNNLYVACTISNAVYEFAPGSTQGTNLGLVLGGEPHGMAFDSRGDLIVAVSKAPNSGSVIDVFPPGKTLPSKQITGTFQPFMLGLDKAQRHLYVADFGSGNHDGAVFEFAYPTGRLVNKYTQGGASGAYGVAVNPPAQP
jgi:DNA-binding beta-propeller fold protein YncE